MCVLKFAAKATVKYMNPKIIMKTYAAIRPMQIYSR